MCGTHLLVTSHGHILIHNYIDYERKIVKAFIFMYTESDDKRFGTVVTINLL